MTDLPYNVKQVICMRTDLKMPKGKMVAQGAHASMKVLMEMMDHSAGCGSGEWFMSLDMKGPAYKWLTGIFTKICVRVDSLDQLHEIYEAAGYSGLPRALITDNGLTCFNGVPTDTCCAIGPWWEDVINEITGDLKLL